MARDKHFTLLDGVTALILLPSDVEGVAQHSPLEAHWSGAAIFHKDHALPKCALCTIACTQNDEL